MNESAKLQKAGGYIAKPPFFFFLGPTGDGARRGERRGCAGGGEAGLGAEAAPDGGLDLEGLFPLGLVVR